LQCALNVLKSEYWIIQLLSSTTLPFCRYSLKSDNNTGGKLHCLWLWQPTNTWLTFEAFFFSIIHGDSQFWSFVNYIHHYYFLQLWICFDIRTFCANNGVNIIQSDFLIHLQENMRMRHSIEYTQHCISLKTWYFTIISLNALSFW